MLLLGLLQIKAAEVPDPTDEFYVNDYADILDTAAKDHIISVNNRLYRDYDVQLVVVTRRILTVKPWKTMPMMFLIPGESDPRRQIAVSFWFLPSVRMTIGSHRARGWKS